jgi:hypothetical protein
VPTNPVNIRVKPSKNASILGKGTAGINYDFLDSMNTGWNRIRYADSSAYISNQFSVIDSTVTSGREYSRFETNSKDATSGAIIWLVFFAGLFRFLYRKDRKRLMIEIQYELDEKVTDVHNKFIYHFKEVLQSKKVWQYLNAKNNYDLKRNAGAGKLMSRIGILGISGDKKPARFFLTNIQVPNLRLRNTDLYFFPERLIIKRGIHFAAVLYKHLIIQSAPTRFIEDSSVPSDAKIVDYTWKFLNKNGSPDRRFNNNRKLPICLYSDYTFSSGTGVYEIISTSKEGAFDNFARFIQAIANFQNVTNSD